MRRFAPGLGGVYVSRTSGCRFQSLCHEAMALVANGRGSIGSAHSCPRRTGSQVSSLWLHSVIFLSIIRHQAGNLAHIQQDKVSPIHGLAFLGPIAWGDRGWVARQEGTSLLIVGVPAVSACGGMPNGFRPLRRFFGSAATSNGREPFPTRRSQQRSRSRSECFAEPSQKKNRRRLIPSGAGTRFRKKSRRECVAPDSYRGRSGASPFSGRSSKWPSVERPWRLGRSFPKVRTEIESFLFAVRSDADGPRSLCAAGRWLRGMAKSVGFTTARDTCRCALDSRYFDPFK